MRPRNTITLIFLGACLVGWLIYNWPKDYAEQSGNDKAEAIEINDAGRSNTPK